MATRPKGKLLALFAIFIAIGLVTATGAFSSVTAERTATVQTAGDANAFLGFQVVQSAYATTTASDELKITVSSLNKNATTDLGVVFNVTLDSGASSAVGFWVADEDTEAPSGFTTVNDDSLQFYNGTGTFIEGQANATKILPGGSIDIIIKPDLSLGSGFTDGTIVFVADTADAPA